MVDNKVCGVCVERIIVFNPESQIMLFYAKEYRPLGKRTTADKSQKAIPSNEFKTRERGRRYEAKKNLQNFPFWFLIFFFFFSKYNTGHSQSYSAVIRL